MKIYSKHWESIIINIFLKSLHWGKLIYDDFQDSNFITLAEKVFLSKISLEKEGGRQREEIGGVSIWGSVANARGSQQLILPTKQPKKTKKWANHLKQLFPTALNTAALPRTRQRKETVAPLQRLHFTLKISILFIYNFNPIHKNPRRSKCDRRHSQEAGTVSQSQPPFHNNKLLPPYCTPQ